MICLQGLHFDSPNLQDSFNLALFCGIHEKYAMWKFIVDVVNDFVSSLQPDVGRGFLHVSNVFLLLVDLWEMWKWFYKCIFKFILQIDILHLLWNLSFR